VRAAKKKEDGSLGDRTRIIGTNGLLAGCVSVHPDNSLGVAQTHAGLDQTLGFNRVHVPDGTLLRGALMDGQPAYCTVGSAWFALGESRAICLFDPGNTGYFTGYYVLGTIRSAKYDTSVPYTLSTQAQVVKTIVEQAPAAAAAQRAHADCVYQAQMANITTPGLVSGFLAGVGAGSVCENYYRNTGVLP
jgi:hypothetical protein